MYGSSIVRELIGATALAAALPDDTAVDAMAAEMARLHWPVTR